MKILNGLPFAALLLLTACNQATTPADTASAKPVDKPVATVNGEVIGHNMYEFYVKNTVGKPSSELTAEQRGQALDNLVRGEVIAQEAVKQGLDKSGDASSELALSRLQILQQAGALHYLDDKKPSEAEEKAEYDSQVAQMPKTEYHARHILVKTPEEAQKIIDQLKKGAKFEELAKKFSTDSSKDQGGDLGFFSPQTMVPQFSAAVEGLKKGEYTQTPVQTQFGYHVIQLIETREKPVPPFDQVKDRVAQILQQKKFRDYEDDLIKQAKIEKYLDGGSGSSSGAGAASPSPASKPGQ
ncbi:MAG TPA: peptidylprolyl isomerase [Steroidobacteraceae bacterium]|jgi:peptidyl-prolyl cis-trans isomerase C|nr:peptidylprolyl isomerase [Steroidobacteraceae bacterium]